MSARASTGTLLWSDGRVGDARDPAWSLMPAAEAQLAQVAWPPGSVLPMPLWLGLAASERRGLGVWLAPTDEPSALAGLLRDVPLVAVDFPSFRDGRGYSTAALLRSRHGFAHDLRAVGEVLIDQLFYLKRVGFTSFVLRPDQRVECAVAALHTFTETYQRAADNALPLYRRRALSGV